MTSQCTIVMYHFIRELPLTRFPKIKALLLSRFKEQLVYFQKKYNFVTVEDCIAALRGKTDLPDNAMLLTFDDGYAEHFYDVFPLLRQLNIKGCFFPVPEAVRGEKVLDANKIHFILASGKVEDILKYVRKSVDNFDQRLSSFRETNGYDPKEVLFVKRLLQRDLKSDFRKPIVDELFKRYVSADQQEFARQLYMTLEQLSEMAESSMCIGSHGFSHEVLSGLSQTEQEEEIDCSLEFLKTVGANKNDWVMSYPYGNYDTRLLETVRKKGCGMGLTVEVGPAVLSPENALTLPRFDANDF